MKIAIGFFVALGLLVSLMVLIGDTFPAALAIFLAYCLGGTVALAAAMLFGKKGIQNDYA